MIFVNLTAVQIPPSNSGLPSPDAGAQVPTAKSSDRYTPFPLETSSIQLSDEILKLTDLLAGNSHDVWARERMAQGWKWGAIRDDERKEHPALVPYKELPELEKHVNRCVALESIKMAVSLGLMKSGEDGKQINHSAILGIDPVEQGKQIIAQLQTANLTPAGLRRIWADRLPIIWLRDVVIYRRAADAALKLGEWFLAFDIAEEGLTAFRGDLRLRQLLALALARTGATKRANEILEQLRSSGHHDEETLGILARTHKDFWLLSTDSVEKKRHLKLSFELYAEAYRRNRGYYSGINAAALGLICGETEKARKWAEEVAGLCLQRQSVLGADADEQYWLEATLAESALILDDLERAGKHYSRAAKCTGLGWGTLNRTREQARILLEHAGCDLHRLDSCFKLPSIVVCAGHLFDRTTRPQPRFPDALGERIGREIENRLARMDAQVGFCSLGCGSDMLFAEAMLKRGGEINIVLPFNKEDFKAASVNFVPGVDLTARFETILEQAATLTILNETAWAGDAAVYEYCNHVLMGMTLLKGQSLGLEVKPLAIWDGQAGDGRGGTETFVRFWQDQGAKVEIIPLNEIRSEELPRLRTDSASVRTEGSGESDVFSRSMEGIAPQEIKAMLFADIKGYTKLSEVQVPSFVGGFMREVAALMDAMSNPPVARNTWGDAIYCVFDEVADAGVFALNLRELVLGTDWAHRGLPGGLNIRIALHAGPVYPYQDPVAKKLTYLGTHVNRTARIEPIAEEGQIYASQAFAAYSAARRVNEFVCDYVGQKQLAKQFGASPVFLVRRTTRK